MLGQTIGNFRIVQHLGKGGMGEVWLGEQTEVKTRVAIKMLLPQISADRAHVQRFFNEAVAVSKIKHAGIVRIFDVGFVDQRAYLIMEYLDGETLATRVRRIGRLPLAQIADIGTQLAGVLDATHAESIVHRDLKPDNIFLVPDTELARRERVKVLDFGIAKLGQTTSATGPTGATGTASMGTPTYMSPEQWRATAKVDGRADLYSVGCLLFESVCGRPPFRASSIGEMCDLHLNAEPPRAKSLLASVPAELDDLLAGLLAKSPEDRPTTNDIRRVLARIGSTEALGETLPETSPPRARRRTFRRWYVVAGIAAVGAAAASIASLRGRAREARGGPCATELGAARDADGLAAAAACLDRAGSLTEAVAAYQRLQREYPAASVTKTADARLARIYLALGQLELAAQHLESNAELADAAAIRDELGDVAKASDDLSRLAASSDPPAAADAHLRLSAIAKSRGDNTGALAELDRVLAVGDAAGLSTRLFALAESAELRWTMSCPVALRNGACTDVATPAPPGPAHCGPDSDVTGVTLHQRTSASDGVADARAAAALYEQHQGHLGGDEREVIAAYARARIIDANAAFETLLADAPPPHPHSTAEIDAWFARRTNDAAAVRSKLEVAERLPNAEASLSATALLGALEERLARDPFAAPIPEDIHAKGADLDTHCDHMEKLAAPFRRRAVTAYGHCARAAGQLGVVNQSATDCNDALVRLREHIANPLPEHLASPVLPDISVVPGEPLTAAHDLWRQLRAIPTSDPEYAAVAAKARAGVLDVLARGFDPRASALLALLLAAAGEPTHKGLAGARLVLDEAKRRAPASAELHAARGVIAARERDTATALDELAEAGNAPFARLDRGIVLIQIGRYDEAATVLADPLASGSEYEQLVARGVAARGQGHFDDAERDYQLASARDSERPEAYFAAGVLYKEFVAPSHQDLERATKDYETAIAYLRKARPRASGALATEIDVDTADLVHVINQLQDFLQQRR